MADEASDTAGSGTAVSPAGRYSHVAATVENKLYVWGGWKKDTPEVHDGQEKIKLTSTVEILDLMVQLTMHACMHASKH